jgi:hypothetical protein
MSAPIVLDRPSFHLRSSQIARRMEEIIARREHRRKYTIKDIERDLQPVRHAWNRYRKSHDKAAVYGFLREVYTLVLEWRHNHSHIETTASRPRSARMGNCTAMTQRASRTPSKPRLTVAGGRHETLRPMRDCQVWPHPVPTRRETVLLDEMPEALRTELDGKLAAARRRWFTFLARGRQ